MVNREVPRLADERGDLALSAAPNACAVDMQNSDRITHNSLDGFSPFAVERYFTLNEWEKAWARYPSLVNLFVDEQSKSNLWSYFRSTPS